MKTIYYTLFILVSTQLYSQSITITAKDMPIPTQIYELYGTSSITTKPKGGEGQTMDYTNLINPTYSTVLFEKETIKDFTDEGIDVFRSVTKNFNKDFLFNLDIEYDFNEEGVFEEGIYLPEQRYSLAPFTNNNLDSLIIETQGYLLSSPTTFLKFPFTNKNSWTSNSRRGMQFNLTVNAFGLKKVPASMIWYNYRKDTIIGSGTLRIYTPSGPSKPYDVLVDQISNYTLDSFFVNGSPAPLALLNGFGLSQGQKTNVNNRVNIYRKGLFYYLSSFYFGANTFNANPLEHFVCTTDIEYSTSNKDLDDTYSVLVYPNPCVQKDLHIKLMGKNIDREIQIYLTDHLGRQTQLQNYTLNQTQIDIIFDDSFPTGSYTISVLDKFKKPIVRENIVIKK